LETFRFWDLDTEGHVAVRELREAVASLGLLRDAPGKRAIDELVAEIDPEASGEFDFVELRQMLMQSQRQDGPSAESTLNTGSASQRVATLLPALPRRRSDVEYALMYKRLDEDSLRSVRSAMVANCEQLISLFISWGHDHSSQMRIGEIEHGLAALCVSIHPRALRMLFQELDADGSGGIDFDEIRAIEAPRGHAPRAAASRMAAAGQSEAALGGLAVNRPTLAHSASTPQGGLSGSLVLPSVHVEVPPHPHLHPSSSQHLSGSSSTSQLVHCTSSSRSPARLGESGGRSSLIRTRTEARLSLAASLHERFK